MRKLLPQAAWSLAVGYVLAHFLALMLNHWYFAGLFWLKAGLGTVVFGLIYGGLLRTSWARLWRGLGWYWLALHGYGLLKAQSYTLQPLEFVSVLDLEAAMVWVSTVVIAAYGTAQVLRGAKARRTQVAVVERELALRRKLRRLHAQVRPAALALLALGLMLACTLPARAELAHNDGVQKPDRHSELGDPALRTDPQQPALPGVYPTPAQYREREYFFIIVENWQDGAISVCPPDGASLDSAQVQPDEAALRPAGHVLAPVSEVNRKGFTASGWGEIGTVCATAVNAIHIKTDHNYNDGRGVIFSLLPVEQGKKDPHNYKSYLSLESSLLTDIQGGTGIFGGEYAPLVGSRLLLPVDGGAGWAQAPAGWVPRAGGRFAIAVARRKYNPEYIEFENRFGGIIWIKEQGTDPYPIGQVLKPVAGAGRFLGTQYADVGRIRAAHPGVIDISTTPYGVTGGFQIIPRDHAMSPEMTYVRYKTQWMVVGPLWALDPSWEGLPPLFTDYLYPAWNPPPASGQSQHYPPDADAAKYLNSFTVLGRYADSADPAQYELLHSSQYDHFALKNLTHIRIYFPQAGAPDFSQR
jgi:hypothetical protein